VMISFRIRTTLENKKTVEPKETLKMLMMVPRQKPIGLAFFESGSCP